MRNNICKILCIILAILVLILAGFLVHYHFFDPGRLVWKDAMLSDSTRVDTTSSHQDRPDSAAR